MFYDWLVLQGEGENMNEYESFCLCNSIKNNLRPESIVSVLSELAAPWKTVVRERLASWLT